jgi:hypothetical protein
MKHVSRRGLLKGLGAAAVTLPFLQFASRGERAGAADGAPLRLVLWPSLNGCDPRFFWPGQADTITTKPLAPYDSQITYLRGLDIAGSHDHMAIRSMFTGFPIADYGGADPNVKSLDQVVRDVVQSKAPTLVPSLHLGARPADAYEYYKLYGRSTFFFANGAVDYEANPVSAFDRVFGSLGSGPAQPSEPGGEAPQGPDPVKMRNAVLALGAAELGSLRARLGRSPLEVARLDQHSGAMTKLVRDPSVTPVPTTPVTADDSPIASVEALRPSLAGNDRGAYQDALYEKIMDAQIDIMSRALITGVTRVATLQAGSADGNVIVPVDAGYPHHNTSHGDARTFARVQQWYAEKFLRLLRALDVRDPLDPSGKTVLYNSAIVWLSECNTTHESADVPCLVAGSAGGKLATGKYVTVNATNKNLLKTLANVFEAPDSASSHFGGDIISELLA